ncbi:class I SAM-dependent methyltransferase [Halobacteriovorax sp. GB3]|uniref:class I SAM-dependent methyltransferase n=1 Tax=Halobacteriovorax sp. GB3 TaxID=2719615 RepID=UPI0023601C1A|nr:class I SAM-dependent methyltransferase [Halobacteriovorax sp. GB3]MDD0852523.1 class I SAM-dependent methyltransferase [Halobacteriovorax sp. GB3]
MENCKICDSDRRDFMFKKQGYNFLRCNECNVSSLSPMPSMDVLIKHYKEREDNGNYDVKNSSARLDVYHQLLTYIKNKLNIPEKPSLLDIGCFDGLFLDLVAKEDWETYGVELQKNASDIANKKHCGRIFNGAIEEFDSSKKFDYITAFGLIEHMLDPVQIFKFAKKNLKEGGALVIQTPNEGSFLRYLLGSKWFPYAAPEHTFYFSRKSLKKLALKYNFGEVLFDAHVKKLTPEYVYHQLNFFGPELRWIFSLFYKPLPRFLKRLPLPFYGGEMIVTFQKMKNME